MKPCSDIEGPYGAVTRANAMRCGNDENVKKTKGIRREQKNGN